MIALENLVFLVWEPNVDASYPQVIFEKPADVWIESDGKWRYVTTDSENPYWNKKMPIGDGRVDYRKLTPFSRFNRGPIAVFDRTNNEHLTQMTELMFHLGHQLGLPPEKRTP